MATKKKGPPAAKKPAHKVPTKKKVAPVKKEAPVKDEAPAPAEDRDRPKRTDLLQLTLDDLVIIDGFNVRYDMGDIPGLAESIREVGIKVPLRGYKIPKGEENAGKYAIVNGHRRFEAAKIVGKTNPDLRIPLQPESNGYSEEMRTLDMIVTNEGNKLKMLEEAEVVQRMLAFGWDRQRIASSIGKTDQHVADCEVLLTIPKKLKTAIKKNEVAATTVVQTVREYNGDMEAVEGAFFKAQEKAGPKKKVTPKHIPKKKSKPTLATLKDLIPEIEAANPGNKGKRIATVQLVIDFLDNKLTSEDFIAKLYE